MVTRTSEEWQALKPDVVVYDPDGWDRLNFRHSWFEEKITEAEYERRLAQSTIMTREAINE